MNKLKQIRTRLKEIYLNKRYGRIHETSFQFSENEKFSIIMRGRYITFKKEL